MFTIPLAAAAMPTAIGAASNIFGGLYNAFQQNQTNKENIRFAREQQAEVNEYNHPVNVMRRLREAGLNPNLVYNGGAASTPMSAAAPASSKAPKFNMDMSQPLMQYAQLQQTLRQTALMAQQEKLASTQVNYYNELARRTATEGLIKAHDYGIFANRGIASTDKLNSLSSLILPHVAPLIPKFKNWIAQNFGASSAPGTSHPYAPKVFSGVSDLISGFRAGTRLGFHYR